MATIPTLRQLKPEDFDSKDQSLVQKLAFPINTFMQQVISALSNNLDFTNLNQQVNTFNVSVDANGKPISPVQFKINLATKLAGVICINALNTTSPGRYPLAQPFISYTLNAGTLTINNIAGLSFGTGQTNSDVYTLTLLSIGQNLSNN